ncbi:unnamed protein product [Calicophoron daubneyi]
MSAAAAAALLLQAASTGSAVADNSLASGSSSAHRSVASLFDSSRTSSSFPSSVISAAAQQAALVAARSIGTSNTSPVSKSSSELQAAVLSLAMAANHPNAFQSNFNDCDVQSNSPRRRISDLFLLSERPALLTPHSTWSSMLRRRSSTLLAHCSADSTGEDSMPPDGNEKHPSGSNPSSPQLGLRSNLASGPEMDTLRISQSSAACDPISSGAVISRRPDMPLTLDTSGIRDEVMGSAFSSPGYGTSDVQAFEDPVRSDISRAHLASHYMCGNDGSHLSTLHPSTFATSAFSELPATCQSTSPLSCSSFSASHNSGLNISPTSMEQKRGPLSDSSGDFSKSDPRQSSTGYSLTQEPRIKSEFFSPSTDTANIEPNRKREQRLMKNREAARECRRKKKEYVKCLEARVSLLESQNQQLIEELQKVKALCFNELCGLRLKYSTASGAAAMLAAAVTSASDLYSSSLKTVETASNKAVNEATPPMDNCHPYVNQSNLSSTTDGGADGSAGQQFDAARLTSTPRSIRTRRRSSLLGRKPNPWELDVSAQSNVSGSGAASTADEVGSSLKQNSFSGNQSAQTHVDGSLKQDISSCRNNVPPPPLRPPNTTSTSDHSAVPVIPNEGTYFRHPRLSPSSSQTPVATSSWHSAGGTCDIRDRYSSDSSAVDDVGSTRGPNPEFLHHTYYGTKRRYQSPTKECNEGKSPSVPATVNSDHAQKLARDSSTFTGAAVILAAAAAMVADSESSLTEPRLSV